MKQCLSLLFKYVSIIINSNSVAFKSKKTEGFQSLPKCYIIYQSVINTMVLGFIFKHFEQYFYF